MSGTSPWDPVHHEELDDDEPGSTEASGARKTAALSKSESQHDHGTAMAIPIGMSLQVPPEVVKAITSVAEAQDAQGERLDGIQSALEAMTEELRGMMGAAETSGAAARDAHAKEMAGHMEQMRAHHEAKDKAHEKLLASVVAQLSALQTAILAPRRVSLERDKDGMAVGATSQVEAKVVH